MQRNKNIQTITISGVLTAIAILIPVMMPFKLILPDSTYTLASHVPIFIAMFISPKVGIFVALGTTLGFFMSFPIVVALRAASHLAFVIPGALYLKNHKLDSFSKVLTFNIIIAIIHGFAEFSVVALLNFKYLSPQILLNYFIFLGVGSMIHSMIDFSIAHFILDKLPELKS